MGLLMKQGNGVINETVLGSKLNKHDLNLEKKSWLMRPKVVSFDELPTSRWGRKGGQELKGSKQAAGRYWSNQN